MSSTGSPRVLRRMSIPSRMPLIGGAPTDRATAVNLETENCDLKLRP